MASAAEWDAPPAVASANLGLRNAEDQSISLRESAQMKRTEAQSKFRQFLREHHDEQSGSFPYREQLSAHYIQGTQMLEVDMDDIRAFDAELMDQFIKDPATFLPLLETACKEVVRRTLVRPPTLEEMPDFQVTLKNFQNFVNLRDLSAVDVSQLVAVRGIVVSAGKTRVKATRLAIMCRNCKKVKHVHCGRGFGHATIPRRCDTPYVPEQQAQKCPLDPYRILPDSSEYIDQQRLKLQENPEQIPTGEMPRQIPLSVERHLVGQVKPGTRVTVFGIYSTYMASSQGRDAVAGASMRELGIRLPYIRVVGIKDESESADLRG